MIPGRGQQGQTPWLVKRSTSNVQRQSFAIWRRRMPARGSQAVAFGMRFGNRPLNAEADRICGSCSCRGAAVTADERLCHSVRSLSIYVRFMFLLVNPSLSSTCCSVPFHRRPRFARRQTSPNASSASLNQPPSQNGAASALFDAKHALERVLAKQPCPSPARREAGSPGKFEEAIHGPDRPDRSA